MYRGSSALLSPVTKDGSGEVTVHLAHDHPGANDPEYRRRRNEIAAAALAWKPGAPAPSIEYTDAEQEVWRIVCRELAAKHDMLRGPRVRREAKRAVAMPTDEIPNLDDISELLAPLRWLELRARRRARAAAPSSTSRSRARRFHSTQYVRHAAVPLYTPEPDIIHEVIGHGHLLATPTFGELHRLAGLAARRLSDDENLRFLSRVFWFSLEFGVVVEDGEGASAYGAGILSSYGEIEEFLRGMTHRPIDIVEVGTADYDITAYQPVLYLAESVQEIVDQIGWFFATCDDESIAALRGASAVTAGRAVAAG